MCRSGTCQSVPVTCAPIDACHEPGICNAATGVCAAGPLKLYPASDQCSEGYCDLTSGLCAERPKSNGVMCALSDKCVEVAICVDGDCKPTIVTSCGPANTDCTTGPGTCNPATGNCDYVAEPNATPCRANPSDTSNCNSCQNGVCIPFANGSLCTGRTCSTCGNGICLAVPPPGKGAGTAYFLDSDCCSNSCEFFVCAGNFEGDTCGEYNFCSRDSDCCFGLFCNFNRCRNIS